MGIIELLIVLILVCALVGAIPQFGWSWNANGSYGPLGLVVFLILVIILLRVAHIV